MVFSPENEGSIAGVCADFSLSCAKITAARSLKAKPGRVSRRYSAMWDTSSSSTAKR